MLKDYMLDACKQLVEVRVSEMYDAPVKATSVEVGDYENFLNGPTPACFLFFQSFQSNITILQQINVKNMHLVYSAGIGT